MTSHKTHTELVLKGFRVYREWFPWGRCDGYRNDHGELRFVDHGKVYSTEEMYQELKENWIPQAKEEVRWKLDAMEQWFHPKK